MFMCDPADLDLGAVSRVFTRCAADILIPLNSSKDCGTAIIFYLSSSSNNVIICIRGAGGLFRVFFFFFFYVIF